MNILFILFILSPPARADFPNFGPYDVPTLFFINKSDDLNRVDYGLHLDSKCNPIPGDEALFFYWREFENSPPVRVHDTNFLDRIAYGIQSQHILQQRLDGTDYFVRLKKIDRDITIHIEKSGDQKCIAIAQMEIAGVPKSRLISTYVKLAGPLSVQYIEIHGIHPKTGAAIQEKIMH